MSFRTGPKLAGRGCDEQGRFVEARLVQDLDPSQGLFALEPLPGLVAVQVIIC